MIAMFIKINRARSSSGKITESKLLCESYWKNGISRTRTICNLGKLDTHLQLAIEQNLKKQKGVKVTLADITIEKSIDYGQCFVILEIMKRLRIKQAIEAGFSGDEKVQSKYALLMILGKIITRGSKLGIANWVKRNEAIGIALGFTKKEINSLTERNLYAVQFDINNVQDKIQEKWRLYNKKRLDTIFLYDITSFYFEGTQNELACFGYNRDKKQGKQIITVGLVTDKDGFPLKIEVFKGNTKDEKTLQQQLSSLKNEFKAKHIILIGDRGMKIKYNLEAMEQRERSSTEGIRYITGLTTSEIKELEESGVIQMSLFDEILAEVERSGKRYVLCVNPILEKEKKTRRQNMKERFELELLSVQKSFETQKEKCKTNRIKLTNGHKNKKLKIELTEKEIKTWEYKIRKAQEKYKMKKVYTVTINGEKGEESIKIEYDALAYEALTKFDGKYVFETTVEKDVLNKEEIRATYRQLQEVEHAFRDMKTSRLDLRPIFHRKEETTRSHVFLGMFSYAVVRKMENALCPWLREQKKTKTNKISFNDAMEEMKMIRLCVLSFGKSIHQEIRVTKLNDNQKKILSLLNINEKILVNHP